MRDIAGGGEDKIYWEFELLSLYFSGNMSYTKILHPNIFITFNVLKTVNLEAHKHGTQFIYDYRK